MKIDARDLSCPLPVVKTKEALSQMTEGTVEILVGNENAVHNLSRFATGIALPVDVVKEADHWKVTITKKPGDQNWAVEEGGGEEKRMFMVVGTDSLGKEEQLGKILIIRFFEAMKLTKKMPDIFFF